MLSLQRKLAVALLGGLALAGCASHAAPPPAPPPPPAPVKVIQVTPFVAKVVSINQRTRQVGLLLPDDKRVTIVAGPEVTNLPQVRRGDAVSVTLGEAVAVAMASPGSAPAGPSAIVARRKPGQRPGGIAGQSTTVRMTVTDVDPATGRVAATNPDGIQRVVTPRDPAMIEFAKQLHPGDQVDVTYTALVAVRVDPNTR